MRHAGAGAGKQVNLGSIKLDTMRVPDIIPGPAHGLGIITRTHPELRKAVIDILDILGQMRMQTNAKCTRHIGCFAHQVHRH